jgi:hypothetical protein
LKCGLKGIQNVVKISTFVESEISELTRTSLELTQRSGRVLTAFLHGAGSYPCMNPTCLSYLRKYGVVLYRPSVITIPLFPLAGASS